MIVSKKLADLKLGDLVANRDLESLESWVSHGIEVVKFERVGTVVGFNLDKASREVLAQVQWLDSPEGCAQPTRPSTLMKLSA